MPRFVIFSGTQHVELISLLLAKAARKFNTAKFTIKKVNVLVMTDIVVHGLDIPTLNYVVNVHFPGKPKLIIHRVGCCARAGRSGVGYNIFSSD